MKGLAVIFLLLASGATAAPDASLRPVARSANAVATLESSGAIKPAARPEAAQAQAVRGSGPKVSLRPELRPRKFRRIARQQAKLARKQEKLRRQGAVCNDPDIQGDVVGRVNGSGACGIEGAVRVRSVSGIGLSQSALIDCRTAKALKTWIDQTAKPTLKRAEGGLDSLRVAAHYACRTRNNQPGARISEHGKGRAIDISGVKLRSGRVISVLHGWNAKETSSLMRKLHKGACGPFGTVLGPNSDRFHRDHFHFDTARYRSGSYCR